MSYDEKVSPTITMITPSHYQNLMLFISSCLILLSLHTVTVSLSSSHLQVDIYSYGIVLFQLITSGHTPFEELSVHERDKAVEQVP